MHWIDITEKEDTGLLDAKIHHRLAKSLRTDAINMVLVPFKEYHFNELMHYTLVRNIKIFGANYGVLNKRFDCYQYLKIENVIFVVTSINNRLLHIKYKILK